MAEDQLDHIFEEFCQAEGNEHMAAALGKGLGLSIAKRFVQMHGSRMWVVSEVGKGSTFYFTLSLAQKQVAVTRLSDLVGAHEALRKPPSWS